MFKRFIERPVLATVISALLVILGVLGIRSLPLERFPDIAPPAVQVTALYPGANAGDYIAIGSAIAGGVYQRCGRHELYELHRQ